MIASEELYVRCLLLCLALAACSEPQRTFPSPSWDGMSEPTTDPADNIATIGAQGLCADHERPVVTSEGASVTGCEASPDPAPSQ
jgi:hypothetical protein